MTAHLQILQGDSLQTLRTLADESVQCCITSPPYYGLRDYGLPPSIFGGNRACGHKFIESKTYTEKTAAKSSSGAFSKPGEENKARLKAGRWRISQSCELCGAWRGQLGLEETPELFIEHLTEIFEEVRRVLKKDGTLWLNLGDSYSGSGRGGNPTTASSTLEGSKDYQEASMIGRQMARGSLVPAGMHENRIQAGAIGRNWEPPPPGLKNKDLIGIPWMAAFALRKAGWFLRQDIIWSKPNPMPESVTDRCTKSHEYVFLLSRSSRYYYDSKAIEEPQAEHERSRRLREQREGLDTKFTLQRDRPHGQTKPGANGVARSAKARQDLAVKGTRNKRSVWTIPCHPYREAHFATFPAALIRPMILASCPASGIVLDPFGGSGTTGAVALELDRRAILCELNPDYVRLIRRRCERSRPHWGPPIPQDNNCGEMPLFDL